MKIKSINGVLSSGSSSSSNGNIQQIEFQNIASSGSSGIIVSDMPNTSLNHSISNNSHLNNIISEQSNTVFNFVPGNPSGTPTHALRSFTNTLLHTGFNNNYNTKTTSTTNNQTELFNSALNSESSVSPLFNTNTILTRSAAVKAAQQLKQTSNHLVHSNRRGSHGMCHHHQHQHAIGKIVKPIPVRPVSSASSSAASTHSSYSSNKHKSSETHHHHQQQQPQHSATNIIPSTSAATAAAATIIESSTPNDQSSENFSLIAKYFASFPATRLKSSSASSYNFISLNTNTSPVHNTNHQTSESKKSTPFLPFKKIISSVQNTQQLLSTSPCSHQHQQQQQQQPQQHQPLSSFLTSNNFTSTSGTTNMHLRSHTHHNTDHLCTNFKRMIKLNDTQQGLEQSEHNSATHTPQCTSPNRTNSSNTPINDNINNNNLDNYLYRDPASYLLNPINVDFNSAQNEFDSRLFGQITMETRSTRKFIIKHHPYLQLNRTQNSIISSSSSSTSGSSRPSIDLIKMKKIQKNSSKLTTNSPVSMFTRNNNGRISRTNDELVALNQQLVKFTDTAPLSPKLINSKRKTSCSSTKKSKTKTNLSRSPPVDYEHLDTVGYKTDEEDDADVDCDDYEDYNYDYNEAAEDINNHNTNNEYDEENCDIDDSKEDSSGYYSSYHSVDLISSSGGSSLGDINNVRLSSAKSKNINGDCSDNKIVNTPVSAATTVAAVTTATIATSSTSNVPHHHYHTRYLCNQQKKELLMQQNKKSTIKQQQQQQQQSVVVSNTPTTRLRSQQQQLKNNNNNTSISSSSIKLVCSTVANCDLDLDQIEND